MMLGSTLQWFAPTDVYMSSVRLFASSDQWRSLFERSTLGVAMIDAGFRFLEANPTFLTMFGYSSEELQRLSFLDICIDEVRDECRVPLRELRDGVRFQYETKHNIVAKTEHLSRSTLTFHPLASAGRISARSLRSPLIFRHAGRPKKRCARLNRSWGGSRG
jgi:PAS domain-containing protein